MQRNFLGREQICPSLAFGIREAPPDEVIQLMGEDADEVRGMGKQFLIEDDFAPGQKTGGVDFVTRSFTGA